MKIQYCSDLHLEFEDNFRKLKEEPLEVIGDLLILAGDIIPLNQMKLAEDFFDLWSSQFQRVFWIAGNHEFYHSDISKVDENRNVLIRENDHLLDNVVLKIGDIQFIFSTMWSHIGPLNVRKIQRGMADFRLIRSGEHSFTIEEYNERHIRSVAFIEEALRQNENQKSVVVTHHIPTFMNYPQKYIGDVLSEGFATEYFFLMETFGPDYWIYGHHHTNVPEFKIGKTNLITNQLGYVKYSECRNFDRGKVFEL